MTALPAAEMLNKVWEYSLFDALYGRRTRRFGLGFEMAEDNYILDTYGRFPGGVDAMHLMWFMQVHHIDADFYDRFFSMGRRKQITRRPGTPNGHPHRGRGCSLPRTLPSFTC